jgi:hypothetical protein
VRIEFERWWNRDECTGDIAEHVVGSTSAQQPDEWVGHGPTGRVVHTDHDADPHCR